MGGIVITILYILGIIGFIVFGRVAYVVIGILCGDKQAIHEAGNFCEEAPPIWNDDYQKWRNQQYWKQHPRDNWRNWGEGDMN